MKKRGAETGAGPSAGLGALALALLASPALAQTPAQPAQPPARTATQADREAAAKLSQERVAAILAADIDGYIAKTRQAQATTNAASGAIVIAVDQLSQRDFNGASATIAALTRRSQRTTVGNLLDMWSLLLQGKKQEAYAKADEAKGGLVTGLGSIAKPLLLEAGGDLKDASQAYDTLIAGLDTSPLTRGAPADAAAARRVLAAPRLAQVIYRAALLHHRLGNRDDALKYYLLSDQFAPGAPDIGDNLARLERGAPPRETPLNARTGLGRWMFMVGYQFALDYGLAQSQASGPPADPLDPLIGPIFAQLGLKLDPAADELRVATANDLIGSGGAAGAEKLLTGVSADSPFAADVEIALARISIGKKEDNAAAASAMQALKIGGGRWDINLEAGRALTVAGRDREALAALTSAVDHADGATAKAEALLARAGAHFQAGRLTDAGQDARAAVAADNQNSVQMSAAGYLSTTPEGWFEAIRLAREVLFARPRSVDAMNTLGYALIQREQGLDEGFKLLSLGMAQSPDFYPIVDSLGWAYYNLGNFEMARELVSRANDLSKDDPNSEVLDHLGDIQWRLKKPEEARKLWRQALDYRPDATRRADLDRKIRAGLTAPAPARRAPPVVDYNPYRAAPDRGPI